MPGYERVLVALDGSDLSAEVARAGIGLAASIDAEVTICHVVDASAYANLPQHLERDSIKELLEKEGRAILDKGHEEASRRGITAEERLLDGVPAQALVEASSDHDLLVIGTHGRTGLAHLFMGSVAEKVIRHAPVPVLVVREDRTD